MTAMSVSAVPATRQGPIRVVVVDDSPAMRLLLQEIINRQPDMRVVGVAPEPYAAREMIRALQPDLITLDIEMPGMDGLTFLERLMRLHPLPVLMISSAAGADSALALQALDLGAFDFIGKRSVNSRQGLNAMAAEVVDKIRAAAEASPHFRRPPALLARPPHMPSPDVRYPANHLICVGASTGGTEAIMQFLLAMPANAPATLIVQHMPEAFTARFAARLDSECAMHVKEAVDGEMIRAGCAYLSPGNAHLLVRRIAGGGYQVQLSAGPEVNRHRPAVDVLFRSAAEQAGCHATGVLLTGMGKDGADGLAAMKSGGAHTLAQDESSCVVYGMPRAAIELQVVDVSGPPDELAGLALARLVDRR